MNFKHVNVRFKEFIQSFHEIACFSIVQVDAFPLLVSRQRFRLHGEILYLKILSAGWGNRRSSVDTIPEHRRQGSVYLVESSAGIQDTVLDVPWSRLDAPSKLTSRNPSWRGCSTHHKPWTSVAPSVWETQGTTRGSDRSIASLTSTHKPLFTVGTSYLLYFDPDDRSLTCFDM